jgi:hypothetical protein
MEFRSLKDLALLPPDPERHWLLEGILPAGSITDVRGPARSGKSLFCAGLAASVSTGAPAFGKLRPERMGPVVYATHDPYGLNKTLRAVLAGAEQQLPADLTVVMPTERDAPDVNPKDLARTFVDKVLNLNPRPILVIDDDSILSCAYDVVAESIDKKMRDLVIHEFQRLIRIGTNVVVAHRMVEPTVVIPYPAGVRLWTEFDSAQSSLTVVYHVQRDDDTLVGRPIIHTRVTWVGNKVTFQPLALPKAP